jgi:hypothetical protein
MWRGEGREGSGQFATSTVVTAEGAQGAVLKGLDALEVAVLFGHVYS